jgi:hypothetical protein
MTKYENLNHYRIFVKSGSTEILYKMLSSKSKIFAKIGSVLAVVYLGVYHSHFFADCGEIRHRRTSHSTFEYLCVVKVSAVKSTLCLGL